MQLENTEIVEIAGLKENLAYKLLLDRLKSELDTLQQNIVSFNAKINPEMIQFWKALHHIYLIFKLTPEDMTKELEILKNDINYRFEEDQMQAVPKEYLQTLMNIYQQRKSKE